MELSHHVLSNSDSSSAELSTPALQPTTHQKWSHTCGTHTTSTEKSQLVHHCHSHVAKSEWMRTRASLESLRPVPDMPHNALEMRCGCAPLIRSLVTLRVLRANTLSRGVCIALTALPPAGVPTPSHHLVATSYNFLLSIPRKAHRQVKVRHHRKKMLLQLVSKPDFLVDASTNDVREQFGPHTDTRCRRHKFSETSNCGDPRRRATWR